MEIAFRRYRDGDEKGIVELLRKCFRTYSTWGVTEEDWLLLERIDYGFDRRLALVAELGGRIVGHVHLVHRVIRVGSSAIDVGGVANVSTDPSARGRGIARRLMIMALELAKERGYPLSSLLTGYCSAGYRVYRSIGYADTFFLHEFVGYRDRVEKTLRALDRPSDIEVRELELRDLDRVVELYERYSMLVSGSVWRPRSYWIEKFFNKVFYYSFFYDEPSAALRLAAYRGGELVGYAIGFLQDKAKRPYWAPGTGVVIELVSLDSDALSTLLSSMLSEMLRDGARVIRVFTPKLDGVSEALRFFERFRTAIYMDYVIDQIKLFEKLKPELKRRIERAGGFERLQIDISSPFGCTQLSIRGLEVTVSSCGSDEVIELDRDGIAKLVYGVSDLDTVLENHAEHISASRRTLDALRKLFPKRATYVNLADQW